MVFKGRFFNFKKSDASSSDGSPNSPRSFGSSSPSRFDKKKAKSTAKDPPIAKKKDAKGKESPNSGLKSNKVTAELPSSSSSSSVSPILASSLGLNRIKTRSGPLPQESFFGFRNDKGSNLGASNLSRPAGADGEKKEESVNHDKLAFLESSGSGNWVDNGSNSDSMSTGSAQSRDQSPNILPLSRLQNVGSSSAEGLHSHKNFVMVIFPVLLISYSEYLICTKFTSNN